MTSPGADVRAAGPGVGAPARALILVGIGLLVLGLVSVAIHCGREDRGWLRAADGGDAWWPAGAVPLVLVLEDDAAPWAPVLTEAAERWSSVAGRAVIVIGGADPGALGAVPVTVAGLCDETRPHARLSIGAGGAVHLAAVALPLECPPERRLRIAVHELGHLLLLEHDDAESSALYPAAGLGAWDISDADRARIRGRYGP